MKRLLIGAIAGLVIIVASTATFDYAVRVGRNRSHPASNGRTSAPDVVGLGRDRAIQLLSQRGFSTVAIVAANPTTRPGIVLRQSSHRSTHTASRQVEKLLISSGPTSSCSARRQSTTVRVRTGLHSPELTPRCIGAEAGRRLTVLFRDNLVGAPANLSIYPDSSSAFAIVDGQFVVTPSDRAHALFIGHRSWLPRRITYHVDALKPGTYVVQGDSYPSLMRAKLVVRPVTR
jgi:hypothetical protein